MDTLYKLTRPDLTTYNGFQWTLGKEQRFSGKGTLCGPGFAHAYLSPELAVLLNPIHADYDPAVLFRCEGIVARSDHQLKVGCTALTLIEAAPMPVFTIDQRVIFAVRGALTVYPEAAFVLWAERWLNNTDRTRAAARAAAWAAEAAAWPAAEAAAWPAARAAAEAARAAAR
jgi:hypothetical protein